MITTQPAPSFVFAVASAPRRAVSQVLDGFARSSPPESLPTRAAVLALVRPTQEFEPTEPDILGPYYREGAPIRHDMLEGRETTDPMFVWGQVKGTDGTPIEGAMVDVWLADKDGHYDDSPAFRQRARMKTSEEGYFWYTAERPGNYEIPGQIRPAHIHYKVTAPGKQELVTQTYFSDDPYNEQDPWFSEKRIMPTNRPNGEMWTGRFDFVLAPAKEQG